MAENDIIGGGPYGIRIPAEEAASLIRDQGFYQEKPTGEDKINTKPNGESTEAQPASPQEDQPKQTEEIPAEEQEKEEVFKVGDLEYTQEDILKALDDSENKEKWQKSQTEKDQQLAHDRKAVQDELKRFNSLKEDSDLMDTLKEFLGEDHSFFQDSAVALETQESQDTNTGEPTTTSDPVAELKSELDVIKAERQLEANLSDLQNKYPELQNNSEAISEVLKIAADKEMFNLEDAYKIARFDTAESSAVAKAYNAFKEAQQMKDVPEATGEVKGDHSEPVKALKDYDSIRDHVLSEYDLVTK